MTRGGPDLNSDYKRRGAELERLRAEIRAQRDVVAAAENLCGDVYLYGLGEITIEQLMESQGKTLRAVAAVVSGTPPRPLPTDTPFTAPRLQEIGKRDRGTPPPEEQT